MNCRKCGAEITGENYRKVAHWTFCLPCFEEMMRAAEKNDTARYTDASSQQEAEIQGTLTCSICNRNICPGDEKHLGIWNFCKDCYRSLVPQPPPDIKIRADMEAPEPEPLPPGPSAEYLRQQAVITCAGCGRKIHRGGSRERSGVHYCPDCFYKLQPDPDGPPLDETQLPPARPGRLNVAAGPHQPPPDTYRNLCESCGNRSVDEETPEYQGFRICKACLASDPELAVEIAREKHRRRLLQIKKKMQTDPDPNFTIKIARDEGDDKEY